MFLTRVCFIGNFDRHMEKRRQLLEQIEKRLPPPDADHPLLRVFRRLDAIQEMIRRRERKGGCIIGNLSTALSDTHDAFRRRLAECHLRQSIGKESEI